MNTSQLNALYDISVDTIDGKSISLGEYKGKVLLIVNVASKCGFTPQYEGLQSLYERYQQQGAVVLGFPCNQFAAQEPGDEKEIAQFCSLSYGVSFPLFAKVLVNGKDAHPLYQLLKSACPGVLGTPAIKWNFTKFLVDRQGEIRKRFPPSASPKSLEHEVEALL